MSGLLASTVIAGLCYTDNNIEYQNSYLDYLKNEYYVNYTPCDEHTYTFDGYTVRLLNETTSVAN